MSKLIDMLERASKENDPKAWEWLRNRGHIEFPISYFLPYLGVVVTETVTVTKEVEVQLPPKIKKKIVYRKPKKRAGRKDENSLHFFVVLSDGDRHKVGITKDRDRYRLYVQAVHKPELVVLCDDCVGNRLDAVKLERGFNRKFSKFHDGHGWYSGIDASVFVEWLKGRLDHP